MISGMSSIWSTLERNSQKAKAIGGSNCSAAGASRFQPSQSAVHTKITRKNPIVPTCSVIHTATLSSGPMLSAISLLMSRKGGRRCLTSSSPHRDL